MRKKRFIASIVFVLAVSAGVTFFEYRRADVAEVTPSTQVANGSTATRGDPHIPAAAPIPTVGVSSQPTTTSVVASSGIAAERSSYTIPVIVSGSVLEAMRAFASSSAFVFTGHDYPVLGFFVDSINGKGSADGFNWMLYINGKESPYGASSAVVSHDDTVEWRYERGR